MNRFLDYYMNFNETRTIPGLSHFNLIKLGDNEPFYLNYFFFLTFYNFNISRILQNII